MRFVCTPAPLKQVRAQFDRLTHEMHATEPDRLKRIIRESVPEYQPFLRGT